MCGMKDPDNIKAIGALIPDYMGFIFYGPSPRFVGSELDPALLSDLVANKVGVFVNEEIDEVLKTAGVYGLQVIQLHGNESPEYCRSIKENGLEVIKAIPVKDRDDLVITSNYTDCVDFFLFDTRGKVYGGSGKKFDWGVLNEYRNATNTL